MLAKILLILGGVLTGIVFAYAMGTSTLPISATKPISWYRKNFKLIFDLLELIQREPLGGILLLISLGLLAAGMILYLIGRNME